ncbi:MAG: class flavin-dependent oxidoreductase [Solirubrobacterales bacterium]|jgi:alkanesulfonate monooxygenase SsuD/methylene tetrahydromethanopterin reductase-like flavin-dependent oxidoreductase (luciferase family)|nr:class flavin-dependent oxidoreductase [Solirubrobacterales bacterium]
MTTAPAAPMELGYFTMPLHPPERDYAQTLREDREAIILADRLGYTEAYVGEHVTDTAETVTDCVAFLCSLVSDTKQIRLGTGTVNLPNSHPAHVAAKVAMLDNLLEGRCNFGVSPGGLASDWEMFGTLKSDRRAMFQEAMDHILAIWAADGPIDRPGEHWSLSTTKTAIPNIGQGLMVKPFQKPHPPVMVTAAEPYSKSVVNAAHHGWHIISANFLLPEWVRSHWDAYAEACASDGRTADPAQWRVARSIFVAEDADVAREYAFGAQSPYRFYYDQLGFKLIKAGRANLFKHDDAQPDDTITTDYLLDELVIAGTPEQVADQLQAFGETVGPFGTLLYCGMDLVDPVLGRQSMALMAQRVMPELNRRLGTDAPAVAAASVTAG